MSGWDGHSSGSGPEHEPGEDRGQAAWAGTEGRSSEPPWASAETVSGTPLPPPWGTPPPAPPSPYAAPPSPPAYTPPAPPPSPPAYAPPAPARGPAGGAHRGGRVLAAVAAAAVLGAGAGAGVWYVLLRDGSPPSSAGPATGVTVTTSAPGSSVPSSSAPPSSQDSADSGDGTSATGPGQDVSGRTSAAPAPAPAPGYRRAQDPVGYTLDVPEGWSRRQKQGEKAPVVYYDSPSDGRQLQIFAVTEDSPATSLDLAENDPGYGFARQPGYEALDRASGPTWVELTYRYDDADKGPRQVVDHRFQAADGTLYALRASGPADLPAARVRAPLTAALNSFCPPGGRCG